MLACYTDFSSAILGMSKDLIAEHARQLTSLCDMRCTAAGFVPRRPARGAMMSGWKYPVFSV